MIVIHSNGSKWNGQDPEPIEYLIDALARHTLDPRFEDFGGFIGPCNVGIATWESGHCVVEEGPPIYPDSPSAVHFFGNFCGLSSVFSIDTDEPALIAKLTDLIKANVSTPAYAKARRERGMQDKPIQWSALHQSCAP